MAVSEQQCSKNIHTVDDDDETENGESDMESFGSDDRNDPTFDIVEETRSGLSKLSIKKKSKSRIAKDQDMDSEVDPDEVEVVVPELDEKDKKSFENIQMIIQAGQVGKLKVDQCKVYLRKYGLRLTGNKDTLIQRIDEHLEVVDGGGEKKYPVSSFVLNCKGDACTGDIVMFEQNVYDMFNIASRSASGPPCGTRIVAGRIVKESYGAAKQQHTFTIEVLWSKGEKPHPPLHPLLIKGRNLYRLKTLRQRWEDEGERQKALMEKHSRGSLARTNREVRVQEKEMRKKLKTDRVFRKEDLNKKQNQFRKEELNKNQTQLKSGSANDSGKPAMQTQQMQQLQSHQGQISGPQLSHPVLTGSWNSSSRKENIGLPQTSAKSFNSSSAEILCSGNPKIQHWEKELHHASCKQPLTRINHYPPLSPTRRQSHYPSTNQSTNQFPPLSPSWAQNRYPSTNQCTNQFPPLSPTRRQNHYPSTNQSTDQFPPLSPSRTQNRYPSTNQSTNQFPPLSPTRRQNQYPSTNQWQKQGQMQRQPCRYYAQGRCYFGDNCKFSHELRQEGGQRGEMWY